MCEQCNRASTGDSGMGTRAPTLGCTAEMAKFPEPNSELHRGPTLPPLRDQAPMFAKRLQATRNRRTHQGPTAPRPPQDGGEYPPTQPM